MEFLNNSLLAQLGWKMITNDSPLWVEGLCGKYLRIGVSFFFGMFLIIPYHHGFGKAYWRIGKWWKKVLAGPLLMGQKFIFGILLGFLPCLASSLGRMCIWWSCKIFFVADLLLTNSRSWNVDLLHDLFDPPSVQNNLSIHILQTRSEDKWTWAPSPSSTFSVKSAREVSLPSSSRSSSLSLVDCKPSGVLNF